MKSVLCKQYRSYLRQHGSTDLCAQYGVQRFSVQQAKWQMGNAWRLWDTGRGKPRWAQDNWGDETPTQEEEVPDHYWDRQMRRFAKWGVSREGGV